VAAAAAAAPEKRGTPKANCVRVKTDKKKKEGQQQVEIRNNEQLEKKISQH
jgi:hypothetical protein